MPSAPPTGAATTTSPRVCSTRWRCEPHPLPRWIVVGAGTGGTSATIGRYIRYQDALATTRLRGRPARAACSSTPTTPAGDASLTGAGSRIEGIGRPRVEPSFIRTLVDRMVRGARRHELGGRHARAVAALLGRRVGPSTGTNFVAMLQLAHEMRERGERGAILSLLCDAGERYLPNYRQRQLGGAQFGDCTAAQQRLAALAG
jgi:cysteine synthase A